VADQVPALVALAPIAADHGALVVPEVAHRRLHRGVALARAGGSPCAHDRGHDLRRLLELLLAAVELAQLDRLAVRLGAVFLVLLLPLEVFLEHRQRVPFGSRAPARDLALHQAPPDRHTQDEPRTCSDRVTGRYRGVSRAPSAARAPGARAGAA